MYVFTVHPLARLIHDIPAAPPHSSVPGRSTGTGGHTDTRVREVSKKKQEVHVRGVGKKSMYLRTPEITLVIWSPVLTDVLETNL